MERLLIDSSEFIEWLGALGVLFCAMSRCNHTQLLQAEALDQHSNWLEHLKMNLSWKRAHTCLFLRPPRANTTVFRYNLHQLLCVFLAGLFYLLLLQQDILKQIQEIIIGVPAHDIPSFIEAGPLVIAAFVILLIPSIPPFHRADLKSQKHAVRPCLNPGATTT